MVIHYQPGRFRRNSDQPTAITDVDRSEDEGDTASQVDRWEDEGGHDRAGQGSGKVAIRPIRAMTPRHGPVPHGRVRLGFREVAEWWLAEGTPLRWPLRSSWRPTR
jgi:hypothetical protein